MCETLVSVLLTPYIFLFLLPRDSADQKSQRASQLYHLFQCHGNQLKLTATTILPDLELMQNTELSICMCVYVPVCEQNQQPKHQRP